ncbi:tetratricopeptide repeat protein [Nonomuraea sp. NPDC050404]|uniref:ATP-binding protein n=1 Tax=Nonomuraea sp. NPDC050404 TaxID=3155783 RepID=UPI0033E6DE82
MDNPPATALGATLRVWRERALLTQDQLASRAGLSERTVRRLEAGELRRPRGSTLKLLAEALGLDAEEQSFLIGAANPAPAGVVPRQLPPDVAAFVGRTRELAFLDEAPAAGMVVVTAIDGMGGVGKTALAVRWAHRMAVRFPDGQLYVNLQGYAPVPPLPPMRAVAMLLRGLGVPADQVPAELEEAAGLYRSLLAGRRVLVLLDNAQSAEQVRPLLPGGRECLTVVTSRDRLIGLAATHDVHRLTLDVLDPGEAAGLLTRTIGQERAAAEPAAVTALARLCGRLPLALRIAAANLTGSPDKPIAEYMTELRHQDRLDGLTVARDPQAAVRVAFDHSYNRLAPDRQRLYRLLGLMPGPDISVRGAAALADVGADAGANAGADIGANIGADVGTNAGADIGADAGADIGADIGADAGVEDARRALGELVDAHLLQPHGRGRYSMHDLLRVYARQRAQLHDGQAGCGAAMTRLLDWYLGGAESAAELLYPEAMRLPLPPEAGVPSPDTFADLPEAAAWLDAELTNLVAAAQYAAGHGPHPAAWRLAGALREYFWQRRPLVEWKLIAQAGLDAATAAGDLRAQALGHLSLGQAERAAGRPGPARRYLTRALTLAGQIGWTEGQAAALGCQGIVNLLSGDLQQGADDLARAASLYSRSGWPGGQADSLCDLGLAERELGRLSEAADHFDQAIRLYRKIGSRVGETTVLGALGEIDHDRGRLEAAHRHFTSAMRLHEELGARFGQTYFLRALAAVRCDSGHTQEALATAREALRLAGEFGDPYTEARVRIVLARIHLRLGHTQDAGDHCRRALKLARQVSSRPTEAGARLGLADLCLALDQPTQALDDALAALDLATATGMRVLQGHAHTTLAAACHRLGHHDRALTHARRSLELHRETGHSLGTARALRVLGCALHDSGEVVTAARRWQEALELFTDIGSPEADEIRTLLLNA